MAYLNKKQEALANPFMDTFVPNKKNSYTHGKTTFTVYPAIEADMGYPEKSLEFHINKTAVQDTTSINVKEQLSIIAELHNCANFIDIKINK